MKSLEPGDPRSAGIKRLLLSLLHFFVFSSIFIALCALVMIRQTNDLLSLDYDQLHFFLFVFFSTICSYNFHWGLTPASETNLLRLGWTYRHRGLHILLCIAGGIGAAWYSLFFIEHWPWLAVGAALTFLYSAPKVPFLRPLRRIAIGKTFFLAMVWMYVTAALPVLISGVRWQLSHFLFCSSRFFLIYSICILFDYRDRDYDRQEGIKSMVTMLSDRGVDYLFAISLVIFAFTTTALYYTNFSVLTVIMLLIPGIIMIPLYKMARKNFSDYLYYIILDGMMMLSALLTLFIK